MGKKKKGVRDHFRKLCLSRARGKCEGCGKKTPDDKLEVHHIVNRNEMPDGGYVAANGIALCSTCHIKAEDTYFHRKSWEGYSPNELYARIGSSHMYALKVCKEHADAEKL